jgi:hypothetical protein
MPIIYVSELSFSKLLQDVHHLPYYIGRRATFNLDCADKSTYMSIISNY